MKLRSTIKLPFSKRPLSWGKHGMSQPVVICRDWGHLCSCSSDNKDFALEHLGRLPGIYTVAQAPPAGLLMEGAHLPITFCSRDGRGEFGRLRMAEVRSLGSLLPHSNVPFSLIWEEATNQAKNPQFSNCCQRWKKAKCLPTPPPPPPERLQ